ncbi:MAG: ribosome recycling factor [Microthrixaceae bacterium]|jgi:ribosome recycling factor|nr:ribosome recycling factor [Actinomycetota bacterium]MBP6728856.1 ribosome recycling factor [Microthrixaceae bacterium]HMS12802.1 ribosome recycling factor [Microthrixaceae bacterium]HMT25043.1 ribosome recycling factor [Microthrixaceae bacterium]HMT61926.1 ribosome recycling factor [Microthrixaceae bacterium]
MSEEFIEAILEDATERMAKAVAHTKSEFSGVRSGRASSALIEKLPVEYYGSTVALQQLASFSVPEARLLVVTPFDKGSLNAVERSIREANLGLNPSNDGVQIRLAFPPLTEERRKDFVKMVKGRAEDGRTAVRSARRDARKDLDGLERDGDITEDEQRRAEDELDRLTKRHEAEIDAALDQKTVELMEA